MESKFNYKKFCSQTEKTSKSSKKGKIIEKIGTQSNTFKGSLDDLFCTQSTTFKGSLDDLFYRI